MKKNIWLIILIGTALIVPQAIFAWDPSMGTTPYPAVITPGGNTYNPDANTYTTGDAAVQGPPASLTVDVQGPSGAQALVSSSLGAPVPVDKGSVTKVPAGDPFSVSAINIGGYKYILSGTCEGTAAAGRKYICKITYVQNTGVTGSANYHAVAALANKVLHFTWMIFGLFAILMFVLAGVAFMTAQGDPEKLKTVRNYVLWAIIGAFVAMLAYSMIGLVRFLLGV